MSYDHTLRPGSKVVFREGYENLTGYTKSVCTVLATGTYDDIEDLWVSIKESPEHEYPPYVFKVLVE